MKGFMSVIKGITVSFILISGTIVYILGVSHKKTIISDWWFVNVFSGCFIVFGGIIFTCLLAYEIVEKDKEFLMKRNLPKLKYKYIDNSILLSLETINKNGYELVWEQSHGDSRQILCFNDEIQEFKAFDKYIFSDESNANKKEITGIYYPSNELGVLREPSWETKAVDLWTPIEMIYESEWLKSMLK